MRKELPLTSYERSMNHNYMVLGSCNFFGTVKECSSDYRVRMLLENKIQGLLPVTSRQVNGESRYYYEINSLQSLDRLIEKGELKYRELRAILLGCVNLFDRLEEYLLSGEQIIIRTDYIYVNVESMEPYFVCYPEYAGDVRFSFMEFIDELLTHIDHTDEQAVMLGYQVYRYTRNPNYVLSEIRRFMEYPTADASIKMDRYKEKSQELCFAPKQAVMQTQNNALDKNAFSGDVMDLNRNALTTEAYEEYGSDSRENDSRGGVKGDMKELVGGIFCVLVALCAGFIIVGARVLKCFTLSGNNELYMYGAVAMAFAAAGLFFTCYVKSVRQENIEDDLQDGECEAQDAEYGRTMYEELINRDIADALTNDTENAVSRMSQDSIGETVCLEGAMIEERILRGRVNGKEVNVPLDCLPMTIGKLGSVSDFIINDNAVSKMHARFEEHEGRVCVCDLNSTNGTVRNGEVIEINTPVALSPGDKLRFGRSSFTYC